MSSHFPVHPEADAPQAARPTLNAVKADFGMIPNLELVMATSPELLEGYATTWAIFERTSLTPVERQVVYMTANLENDCDYCIAWHSKLAASAGLPAEEVLQLRAGGPLADTKLRALQVFTRVLIHRRGNPLQSDLKEFLAAGYTPQSALEVVLGIAVKTMSNFTNGLAGTPLDKAVQRHAWRRPTLRSDQAE